MQTTKEMRDRLRELATGRDDFDRAVIALLDDFEAIIVQPIRPAPSMRSTHTFAELEVPAELYDIVADKLVAAEYFHSFPVGAVLTVGMDIGPIDMHGIALTRGRPEPGNLTGGNYGLLVDGGEPSEVSFVDQRADGNTAPAVRLLDDPILGRGKWDSVRFALGDRARDLTDDDIDAIVAAMEIEPARPPVCPSGFAACSLSLPRSSAFAIEDRDACDAGLRRTAGGNDAGGDDHHKQRGADKVPRLASEVGRDRAPSVGWAEEIKIDWAALDRQVAEGRRSIDYCRRMLRAEAPASPAPAAQDAARPLDLGAELRRDADDGAMGGGCR